MTQMLLLAWLVLQRIVFVNKMCDCKEPAHKASSTSIKKIKKQVILTGEETISIPKRIAKLERLPEISSAFTGAIAPKTPENIKMIKTVVYRLCWYIGKQTRLLTA